MYFMFILLGCMHVTCKYGTHQGGILSLESALLKECDQYCADYQGALVANYCESFDCGHMELLS